MTRALAASEIVGHEWENLDVVRQEVSVNPVGLSVAAGGLFTAGCGIFDWEWAMTIRQGRRLSAMIARTGARVFYVVVGVGMSSSDSAPNQIALGQDGLSHRVFTV
jgi:hypothetical protein